MNKMNVVEPIAAGTICNLITNRKNGIQRMIEVVKDEGNKWIKYRGAFGGSKVKRTLRSRIAKVLAVKNS